MIKTVLTVLLAAHLLHAKPVTYDFIQKYLSRAITLTGGFINEGAPANPGFDDVLRLIGHTGALYIGRSVYMWGSESRMPQLISLFGSNAATAHARYPDLALEACVFEIVTTELNQMEIPKYVFDDFSLPYAKRNFKYESMLFPNHEYVDMWGPGKSVPDMRS